MKILSILFFGISVISLIIVVGTYPAEASYASKAKLVQRMRIDAGSALFGEAGTPVGSPQKLIIEDQAAFTGNKTDEGAHIVDEGYLEKAKIYPLQLKTVSYVAGLVRLGASVALLASLGFYFLFRRRLHRLKLVDRPEVLA